MDDYNTPASTQLEKLLSFNQHQNITFISNPLFIGVSLFMVTRCKEILRQLVEFECYESYTVFTQRMYQLCIVNLITIISELFLVIVQHIWYNIQTTYPSESFLGFNQFRSGHGKALDQMIDVFQLFNNYWVYFIISYQMFEWWATHNIYLVEKLRRKESLVYEQINAGKEGENKFDMRRKYIRSEK